MLTSLYEWKILELDEKLNKQTNHAAAYFINIL